MRITAGRCPAFVVAGLVCTLVAGCSLLAIPFGDTYFEPPKKPRCHSDIPPVVDTLVALGAAGYAVAVLAEDCDEKSEPGKCENVHKYLLLVSVPIAIVFGASAATGYVRESKCKRAKQEYRDWKFFEQRRPAETTPVPEAGDDGPD